jgi:hypothetical protein
MQKHSHCGIKTFIEDKYDGAVIPAFQSKETADKLGADY